MTRRTAILLAAAFLLLLALGLGWLLRSRRPAADEEDRLELVPTSFSKLPGWREDDLAAALPALLRSCERIAALPEGELLGDFAGSAADWRPVCAAASEVPPQNSAAARVFFEARFRPFAASNRRERKGLFTGYYEALLQGSRKRTSRYTIPLYGPPEDLVMVDLGLFREELRGRRIAGRIDDGQLLPYLSREEIQEGSLAGRDLELAWVDDSVDAFFLQIQGSGRVRLAEGGEMRVGYAAENGHPYFAIGRDLVERRALRPEEVSMQSIRRWLGEHPDLAPEVLARNASYVFFQEIQGEGPLGAEGVPLTPRRSLAVDRKHWPLGLPVWLETSAPAPREGEPDQPFRHLLIAQDTGGAIRGPVRGDVFWGAGPEAEAVAGRMKHPGRMWVLLPKRLRRPPAISRLTDPALSGYFPARIAADEGLSAFAVTWLV